MISAIEYSCVKGALFVQYAFHPFIIKQSLVKIEEDT